MSAYLAESKSSAIVHGDSSLRPSRFIRSAHHLISNCNGNYEKLLKAMIIYLHSMYTICKI